MEAKERFAWRDCAKSQKIQPYILEAVLKLFEPADDFLYDLDRQRRFISTIHLVPMECPFCDQGCSYYEAVQDADYKIGNGAKVLKCKHCDNELEELVPFIGAVRWGKKHKALGDCVGLGPTAGTAGRQRHPAEGHLLSPDGKRVPGAMCSACANTVISEYREKLGETWTFKAEVKS